MKKKKKIFAIFITLLILFFVLLDATLIDCFFHGVPYLLYPKSPNNIQLMSRTYGLGFCSYSDIYIIFSPFNIRKTGVTYSVDDGAGVYGKNADYIIEWIDDSHVSISFKGNDYEDYKTEYIEY